MKLNRKHIIIIAPGIVLLTMMGLYRLFVYLYKHYAQKADSDYFLIACVVCGTMPLIMGLLYGIYSYLEKLREKQEAEENEQFISDYIEGMK